MKIRDVKGKMNESLPPHLAKFVGDDGDWTPDAKRRLGKDGAERLATTKRKAKDVTPKGYGPVEEDVNSFVKVDKRVFYDLENQGAHFNPHTGGLYMDDKLIGVRDDVTDQVGDGDRYYYDYLVSPEFAPEVVEATWPTKADRRPDHTPNNSPRIANRRVDNTPTNAPDVPMTGHNARVFRIADLRAEYKRLTGKNAPRDLDLEDYEELVARAQGLEEGWHDDKGRYTSTGTTTYLLKDPEGTDWTLFHYEDTPGSNPRHLGKMIDQVHQRLGWRRGEVIAQWKGDIDEVLADAQDKLASGTKYIHSYQMDLERKVRDLSKAKKVMSAGKEVHPPTTEGRDPRDVINNFLKQKEQRSERGQKLYKDREAEEQRTKEIDEAGLGTGMKAFRKNASGSKDPRMMKIKLMLSSPEFIESIAKDRGKPNFGDKAFAMMAKALGIPREGELQHRIAKKLVASGEYKKAVSPKYNTFAYTDEELKDLYQRYIINGEDPRNDLSLDDVYPQIKRKFAGKQLSGIGWTDDRKVAVKDMDGNEWVYDPMTQKVSKMGTNEADVGDNAARQRNIRKAHKIAKAVAKESTASGRRMPTHEIMNRIERAMPDLKPYGVKEKVLGIVSDILHKADQGILEDSDPCWKGYRQLGMKKKNGKEVPNCVPESEEVEEGRRFKTAYGWAGGSKEPTKREIAAQRKRAEKRRKEREARSKEQSKVDEAKKVTPGRKVARLLQSNGWDVAFVDKTKNGYSLKIFGYRFTSDNPERQKEAEARALDEKRQLESLLSNEYPDAKVKVVKSWVGRTEPERRSQRYGEYNIRVLVPFEAAPLGEAMPSFGKVITVSKGGKAVKQIKMQDGVKMHHLARELRAANLGLRDLDLTNAARELARGKPYSAGDVELTVGEHKPRQF